MDLRDIDIGLEEINESQLIKILQLSSLLTHQKVAEENEGSKGPGELERELRARGVLDPAPLGADC